MIVQKNPAVVVSPAPKPLWFQAYPGGYHPNNHQNQQVTEVIPHKAHPFRIPEAWFVEGQKRAAIHKKINKNPWHCQPTHLPCGKTDTAYWACKKTAKAALQNVVHHCQTNLKKSWDSITAQGGAR